MSQRWRNPVRLFATAGLALLVAQSMLPVGAAAVDPAAIQVQTAAPRAKPLKPNLVALKAGDLHIQRTSRGRFIRFESALGNVGRGPIEVRPNGQRDCPRGQHHATQIMYRDVDGSRYYRRNVDTKVARRSAGCMVFHPAHDHWHFRASARYSLFQPAKARPVAVARRKMSFCLRDSARIPASYGTFHQRERYGACSKWSPQGISVGWVDIYQSFLAGQALRLPARARDGLYCLRTKVDPTDQLVESDNGDNTSLRAFTLTGDRIRYRRSSRCT